MKINITTELQYELIGPAVYFFALRCITTGGQTIIGENLSTDPAVPLEEFTVGVGMNRFTRLEANGLAHITIRYTAEVENSFSLVELGSIPEEGAGTLHPDAIPYLFPSRYCQSDRLRQQAVDLFGGAGGKYQTALAISDWVFEHIAYQAGTSNETSSAVDTLETRTGVCRDFAHLTVALCRVMSIPARYVSVYSHLLQPEDFHAVVEVYVAGTWYLLDSTRLAPLDGMVRIATGRDAADVSIATIFGASTFVSSKVTCSTPNGARPQITHQSLAAAGQAFALL